MDKQRFRRQGGIEILFQKAAQSFFHIEFAQTGLVQRILQLLQRAAVMAGRIAQSICRQHRKLFDGSDRFIRTAAF